MAVMSLKDNVYSVGVRDWNRRLFDELIPLPDGTSYNAYVVKGSEKIALIDTVDPTKMDELIINLNEIGIERLDYVISNHAEQDHSGSIPKVLEIYPEAKVVTNAKCKGMLKDLLLIPEEKFVVISDGDEFPLGDKTLKFMLTPWVHWPETMVTYLKEDKILFTCDFFGSHLAASQTFVSSDPIEETAIYLGAKRYYAEIMMPFRISIKKHIKLIESLDVDMIAPSHGLVYVNPKFIIDAYKNWISDKVKNEVVIPYVSMHGSTEKMVRYLTNALMVRGITVKQFDLIKSDIGRIAMALVDAATIVLGSPAVLVGPHPNVVYVVYLANVLKPKLKFACVIGFYGWGSRMIDIIKSMLTNVKVEFLEPVFSKGYPKKEDFKALDRLAEEISEKHKNIGIV